MGNEVEQIKERLGVAEIIGEYIKLEKSGVNYKALCPFHNEKTPSFTVNTERNFWYCFGCQEGGDIFSFVQKMEGLDFREALEKLAERAGVELPKYNPRYKQEKSQKQKITDILGFTTKIYQQQLIKNKKSGEILTYLKKRGFNKEVIHNFKIGYAPDSWRAVVSYLLKKGFALKDILQAGLIIAKPGGDKENPQTYYDRFRDRIMFPIIDIAGKTIGYSARVAPGGDEATAKYINSPQSLVYDKSKVLYGLYQSRQAIRQKGYAIVVEGNADVVLSHRVGIKNIVAVSGTALTPEQVKLLKRYTDKIMLSFDMDEAGQKATKKSIQVCLQNDLQVKIILLPKGYKDVGEVVVDNPKIWTQAIKESIPIMDYYFRTFFREYNVEDIQERKTIVKKLLEIIRHIADPIEQSYWLKKIALRTKTEESLLTTLLEQGKLKGGEERIVSKNQSNPERKEISAKKKLSREVVLQYRLLALLLGFSEELKQKRIDFSPEEILDKERQKIYQQFTGDTAELSEEDNRLLNKYLAELNYKREGDDLVEATVDPLREWDLIITELKRLQRKNKLKEIELALKRAEEEGDDGKIDELMKVLGELLRKE
jgi:DNA primase